MEASNSLLIPLLGLVFSTFFPSTHASYTPFLTPSFSFNYNSPEQPLSIPITTQCETIHVTWKKKTEIGPDPTAPYLLQIYTSAFVFPFIIAAGSGPTFDWAVPFPPGTQYQICMFDKNGNAGGCQAIYTVIPSTSPGPPTCQNVTIPASSLDVEAAAAHGPLSQFGWVDQCTQVSVTPKNGTPPYTLTVAPALHPPYNITSNTMRSMKWTVSQSWGSPFFISVVDSLGNSWATGPLHSGGNGPTACLALDDVSDETWVGPAVSVGAGVVGLVIGLLVGIASTYIFMKYRRRAALRGAFRGAFNRLSSASPLLDDVPLAPSKSDTSQYRPVSSSDVPENVHGTSLASSNPSDNSLLNIPSQYKMEAFVMPSEDGRRRPTGRQDYPPQASSPLPRRDIRPSAGGSTLSASKRHTVPQDGGRPPLSAHRPQGTELMELPPRVRSPISKNGSRGGKGVESLSSRAQQERVVARNMMSEGLAFSREQRSGQLS